METTVPELDKLPLHYTYSLSEYNDIDNMRKKDMIMKSKSE